MSEFAQQPEPNLAKLPGGLQRTGPGGLRQLRALELQGLRVPLIVRLLLPGAEVERRASSSSSGLAIFSVSWRCFL